jgi:hypothetical protein
MPTVVWAGVAVLVAASADAWFSSGLLLTPMMLHVASAMSLAASSFPKIKRKRTKEDKD